MSGEGRAVQADWFKKKKKMVSEDTVGIQQTHKIQACKLVFSHLSSSKAVCLTVFAFFFAVFLQPLDVLPDGLQISL